MTYLYVDITQPKNNSTAPPHPKKTPIASFNSLKIQLTAFLTSEITKKKN